MSQRDRSTDADSPFIQLPCLGRIVGDDRMDTIVPAGQKVFLRVDGPDVDGKSVLTAVLHIIRVLEVIEGGVESIRA